MAKMARVKWVEKRQFVGTDSSKHSVVIQELWARPSISTASVISFLASHHETSSIRWVANL